MYSPAAAAAGDHVEDPSHEREGESCHSQPQGNFALKGGLALHRSGRPISTLVAGLISNECAGLLVDGVRSNGGNGTPDSCAEDE